MHSAETQIEGPEAEPREQTAPVPPVEEKPDPPPEPAREAPSLEDRVRRLEDIIATIQLARPARPSEHITEEPPRSNDCIVAAPPAPSAFVGPPAPPPQHPLLPRSEPWLAFEIIAELRAIGRMYFDPRYRMSWRTRLLTPLLLVAIVLCRWWVGSVPIIGWVLDLVLFPVLLYVLIKVLSREATRYRLTSPDLPHTLRL